MDLEDRSKDELLEIINSAYQAVGAIAYETGLLDNADIIRLQDVLAYGKTEDGIHLLPFPKAPLVAKLSESQQNAVETLAIMPLTNRNLSNKECDVAVKSLAEAGAPDVEITSEMMAAGEDAFYEEMLKRDYLACAPSGGDLSSIVSRIFLSMWSRIPEVRKNVM